MYWDEKPADRITVILPTVKDSFEKCISEQHKIASNSSGHQII